MREKGFTLVELLIAMAIMGILAAIATPDLTSWINTMRLQEKSEMIMAGVSKARAEALKRNVPITIDFDAKGNWGYGCYLLDTNQDSNKYCPKEVIESYSSNTVDDNTAKITFSPSSTSITFNGLGGIYDSSVAYPNTILIESTDANVKKRFSIIIKSGGALKMCNPDAVSGVDKC